MPTVAAVALEPSIVVARGMDSPRSCTAGRKAAGEIALAQIVPTSYITHIGTPTNASACGGTGGYSMDWREEARHYLQHKVVSEVHLIVVQA